MRLAEARAASALVLAASTGCELLSGLEQRTLAAEGPAPASGSSACRWPDSASPVACSVAGIATSCSEIEEGDSWFGQDGHYGVCLPSYSMEGDGVRDSITDLLWQNPNQTVTWTPTASPCEAPWRLPSRLELVTLLDLGRPGNERFPAVLGVSGMVWSTTVFEENTQFVVGSPNHIAISDEYHSLLCVQGSEYEVSFVGDEDNTLRDTRTGLEWLAGPLPPASWSEALEACETLLVEGHDDWRLPGIKELESVVLASCSNSLCADPLFSFGDYTVLWSSTPQSPNAAEFLFLDFSFSKRRWYLGPESYHHAHLCVRGPDA